MGCGGHGGHWRSVAHVRARTDRTLACIERTLAALRRSEATRMRTECALAEATRRLDHVRYGTRPEAAAIPPRGH